MPRLGLRAEGVTSRTVRRARRVSPGRTGFEPTHFLDAGGAHGRGAGEERVGVEAHEDGAGVPAACNQAAEGALFGNLLVHVERLRIVLAGEGDHGGFNR